MRYVYLTLVLTTFLGYCYGQCNTARLIVDLIGGTDSGSIVNDKDDDGNYFDNENCLWVFALGDYETITFWFSKLDLEPSENCEGDFVAIYDGVKTDKNLLTKQCSQIGAIGRNFSTSSHEVFILFRTNAADHHKGFRLHWAMHGLRPSTVRTTTRATTTTTTTTVPTTTTTTSELCEYMKQVPVAKNGISSGIIKNKNYGQGNYPSHQRCGWILMGPTGNNFKFQFIDVGLEKYGCNDWISIHDGSYPESPMLAKMCQSNFTRGKVFETSSNAAFVVFHTDSATNGRGFQLGWQSLPKQTNPYTSQQSPNMFNPYASTMNNAQANENMKALMMLGQLFGEDADDYGDDGLYTSYNNNAMMNSAYGFNGQNRFNSPYLAMVTTQSSVATFGRMFDTINSLRCAVTRPINADLTISEGVIENDKDTDGNYYNNDNCTWRIFIPPGMTLRLSFQMVATSGCSDYVAVYDGPTIFDPLLIKKCMAYSGPSSEDFNTSPGVRAALVHFHTDGFLNNLGFKLRWHLEGELPNSQPSSDRLQMQSSGNSNLCKTTKYIPVNGFFAQKTGYIENTKSRFGSYPSNANKCWKIHGPPNSIVLMYFSKLQLEHSTGCNHDYVMIYDGPSIFSPVITRQCYPDAMLESFRTTGDTALIQFRSNWASEAQGFRLIWQVQQRL